MSFSHPPIPPLWSDAQVEVREDGYLLLRPDELTRLFKGDEAVEQPLLLHSTQVFLTKLYPEMTRDDILALSPRPLWEQESATSEEKDEKPKEVDLISEDPMDVDNSNEAGTEEVGVEKESPDDSKEPASPSSNAPGAASKKKKKRGKKAAQKEDLGSLQVYQQLERCQNLANLIQPLILDLATFKHRPHKRDRNGDRQNSKVRALELQQKQLLKSQSNNASSADDMEDDEASNDAASQDEKDDDDDEGTQSYPKEPQIVRLVRTINSIRAVTSHLFQIFNHKRRNDRNLKIGSAGWKDKKRGFCWVLGSRVFDTTSSKMVIHSHEDLSLVLEGVVSSETANRISQDPLGGSPEFWTKSWISEIQSKASPRILDPLTLLTSLHGAPDREKMLLTMTDCDEKLHLDSTDVHADEIQAKYDQAVQRLHQRVSKLLKGRFPDARVSIYGSCLSNLSLGEGADVDLSLWLPEAHRLKTEFQEGIIDAALYERSMKQFVYQVFHKLKNLGHEFRDLQPVTRARVPVVKGTYNFAGNPYAADGSINFDICFLNDIAVANSGLMREYSLVDPRVRKLMMAVKMWAKEHQLNSAQVAGISSYAWINLVVFYLQCIGFLPNFQSAELMNAIGFVPDWKGNIWHSINKLDTWYLGWEPVKTSGAWSLPSELSDMTVSALLYGFFEFYNYRFPAATFSVSVKQGCIRLPKLASNNPKLLFSIEDPFETYDSHCPHDLSAPASETRTRDILLYLQKAEDHLRKVMLGEIQSDKLWPAPPSATKQPQPRRQAGKAEPQQGGRGMNRSAGNNSGGGGPGRGSGGRFSGGRGRGRGRGRGPKPNNKDTQKEAAGTSDGAKPNRGHGPRAETKGGNKEQNTAETQKQANGGKKADGQEPGKTNKNPRHRNRVRSGKKNGGGNEQQAPTA